MYTHEHTSQPLSRSMFDVYVSLYHIIMLRSLSVDEIHFRVKRVFPLTSISIGRIPGVDEICSTTASPVDSI